MLPVSHTLPSSQVWFIPISTKWPQLWRRPLTLLPVLQQGRALSQFQEVSIFCIELSHPGLPFVHNNLHLWPVKWIDPAGTWVQKIWPCFPLSKRLPIRKVTYLETSLSILKFEKARPNQTSQCWGGRRYGWWLAEGRKEVESRGQGWKEEWDRWGMWLWTCTHCYI